MSEPGCVSVVIPVYNGEGFIRASVESALRQTPWVGEVIVVDDGSTDGTVTLAREHGGQVRVLELEHTGNPGAARNAGVENAARELVAFLDADDVWLPGKIAAQLEAMDDDSTVGLVCTNAFRQTERGQESGLTTLLPPGYGSSGDALDALIADNFIIASSVLARRALLVDSGLFSAAEHLPAVEDYDLWLRVCARTRVAFLDEPWLVYRDWGASYRDEWSSVETARGVLRTLERLAESVPAVGHEHRRVLQARRARLFGDIADTLSGTGDARGARSAACAAIAHAPLDARAWKRLARLIIGRSRSRG